MSSNYQAQLDIRFAVFVIWALLFVIFIVFPISVIYLDHLIQKLCRRLGCTCWGCYRGASDDGSDSSRVRGMYYPFLSHAQKCEIKKLRHDLIHKCLQKYSIWLTVGKDTVKMEAPKHDGPDEEGDRVESADDAQLTKSALTEGTETEIDGFDLNGFEDEENPQFTHISIPYPGYDANGVHWTALLCKTKKDQPKTKKRFGYISKLWGKKTVIETQDSQQNPQPQSIRVQLDKKRIASKFCAICLASYEPYDKISWSSNEGCTHVFHTNCIHTWLFTLGEKYSKNQRFSIDSLEAEEMLRYCLECPCCRQAFISEKVVCTTCEEEDEEEDVHVDVVNALPVSEHSV